MSRHHSDHFDGPVWSIDLDLHELVFESFRHGLMLARALQARRSLPLVPDETVALLLLDDDGFVVDLVLVEHPVDRIDDVVDVVLAGAQPAVGALAIYSLDTDEPDRAAEDDIDRFRRWRGTGDDGGIEVLDWFRVGPRRIRSMATTLGEPGCW